MIRWTFLGLSQALGVSFGTEQVEWEREGGPELWELASSLLYLLSATYHMDMWSRAYA